MIATVTLNPAVDKMLVLLGRKIERLNRIEVAATIPGGGGINTAYAIQALGTDVVAMGLIGGMSGRFIQEELWKTEITTDLVHIEGETRTNYIVLNRNNRLLAQINEKGPKIFLEELEDFEKRFERILSRSGMIVLSGSLPRGVDSGIYAELINKASRKGIRTVLNASGEALLKGIKAQPAIVKPDIRAMDSLLGIRPNTTPRRVELARKILKEGAQIAIVGGTREGQVVATQDKAWEVAIPLEEAVNIVGAGDAFIGGLAHVLAQDGELSEAIRVGAAASAASTLQVEAKVRSREQVEQFLGKIELKELSGFES
ncbi:MAG: hexose kinase [Actinomycetota bacterium]|nr:hexose kinase [Actinomycetota bacterium]